MPISASYAELEGAAEEVPRVRWLDDLDNQSARGHGADVLEPARRRLGVVRLRGDGEGFERDLLGAPARLHAQARALEEAEHAVDGVAGVPRPLAGRDVEADDAHERVLELQLVAGLVVDGHGVRRAVERELRDGPRGFIRRRRLRSLLRRHGRALLEEGHAAGRSACSDAFRACAAAVLGSNALAEILPCMACRRCGRQRLLASTAVD